MVTSETIRDKGTSQKATSETEDFCKKSILDVFSKKN